MFFLSITEDNNIIQVYYTPIHVQITQTIVTSIVFESKDDPTQMTKAVIYNYILYYIQKTIHSRLICTNVHS